MNRDYTIQVECLMPERLIDRATAQGARFSSIRLHGGSAAVFRCDAGSAKLLLTLCERFSIPARVLRREGRSALAAFAKRRRTLPAGVIVFAALCFLFLSRVWRVDIAFTGDAADYGNRAALQRALSEAGIAPGMSRADVDTGLLAQELEAGAESYSYVGARLHGVRLLIEAAPEIPAPAVYDVDAARDLVSDRDGIVVYAVARSGQLCVKPGDAVRRGQLLIRGEEKFSQDQTRPIAALGEVVVRAWYSGEAVLSTAETIVRETGRSSFAAELIGPGFTWPITRAEAFDSQAVETTRVPIGGLFLPLEIERSTYRETQRVHVDANRDALKARLAALAFADAARRLSLEGPRDYEIDGSWVDYMEAGGTLRAQAVYEIHANAAVTREVLQGG